MVKKRQSKCDILNIEWSTRSRDTNIVEPILSYLELKYDYNIIRTSMENFLIKLNYYNPRLLLLTGYLGAPENLVLARQAYSMGIKIVSLVSEGVFPENINEDSFWGWDYEHKIYHDIMLVWSTHMKEVFLKVAPEISNFYVVGATGFDRYKLLRFTNKEDFLKSNNWSYNKVICIASSYYSYLNINGRDNFSGAQLPLDKNEIAYLLDTRIRLNKIYDEFISSHNDTLFILKYHPASFNNKDFTEFVGLDKHSNTLEIQNEIEISDLINISDFWISFESTTAVEAWLLNKQTLFVNPTGGYFSKSKISDGSIEITSISELQLAYEQFYSNGEIANFKNKSEVRKRIISELIGYDDGRNHIRAAEKIIEVLNDKTEKKLVIDNKIKKEKYHELYREIKWFVLSHSFFIYCSKRVREYKNFQKRYSNEERKMEIDKYKKAILKFDKDVFEV